MKSEITHLNRKAILRVYWFFLKRDLKLWTYFKLNFLFNQAEVLFNLVIYLLIARFKPHPSALEAFNYDYISFVIIGIAYNILLTAALSASYEGLMDAFWNNRLEIILMSPIRLGSFAIGTSIGGYVKAIFQVVLLFIISWLLFSFHLQSGANYLLAFLFLSLGITACTGLGLMAASMVYFVDARGGQDPIRLVVGILSGLVAGVYFPIKVLPGWLQWAACIIPHTYAIDGARQALLSGGAYHATLPIHSLAVINPIWINILILLAYSAVTIPLGWWMFERGIAIAKTDGRLARWV